MQRLSIIKLSAIAAIVLILLIPGVPRWVLPFTLAVFFLYAPIVIEKELDSSLIDKYKPFCYVISGAFILLGLADLLFLSI